MSEKERCASTADLNASLGWICSASCSHRRRAELASATPRVDDDSVAVTTRSFTPRGYSPARTGRWRVIARISAPICVTSVC